METIANLFDFNLGVLLGKIGARSLFWAILVEEAGVPLPVSGDIFLLTAGRNSLHSHLGWGKVLYVTTLGTILGASFLYFLSRTFGRALILRYGRYLRINEPSVVRVEGWFQKHGGAVILVGRLIPGFRTVSSIVAGLTNVHYLVFLFYTILATVIWATSYFWAGRFLGRYFDLLWKDVLSRPYLTLLGTFLGAAGLAFLIRKIAKNSQK